jgi:two-component system C4-dicarboxylate transport response regulator DctD
MAPTILIVDDEPDLVMTCQRLLRPRGHRCLGAGTGAEGIALIDREAPDLVVTDLRLPGADGIAVARHARARVPPIPVLLISADESTATREVAKAAGVGTFLSKPFANAAFLEAVERLLEEEAASHRTDGSVRW